MSRPWIILPVTLGLAMPLVVGGAGCADAPRRSPTASASLATAPTTQRSARSQDTAFWYDLARRGAVTNAQATTALLSHFDDPAADAEYGARVARLKEMGYWPEGFRGAPEANVNRGDVAVAICRALRIRGGLTAAVVGLTPRYATRALIFEGIYPDSTPNQAFTGAEFVGILGAMDDRTRGDPSKLPAEQIPGYEESKLAIDGPPVRDYRLEPLVNVEPMGDAPVYMMLQDGSAAPAGATTQGVSRKLRVFVTAVQGEQAEFKRKPDSAWERARVGLVLDENAEFRTGDKSSIRFNIPPGQTFTLDRLSSCKVSEAAFDGSKVKTTVGLEQGRVRMDVNPTGPGSKREIEKVDFDSARMAEAGVVHDTQIRSPNSALAVRGTRVSLLDQPPYAPLATSLTGRAEFLNTRRQVVAFGAAGAQAQVQGDDGGAADSSGRSSQVPIPRAVGASAFDAAQLNRVIARGGFLRGDVIVGNASVDFREQFRNVPLAFVMQFGNPGSTSYQDLNLYVASPVSTADKPDFVANGPFTEALNNKAPGYAAYRAANYPKVSAVTGGQISRNAVTVPPDITQRGNTAAFLATEVAAWGRNYPVGDYQVEVTNFVYDPQRVDPNSESVRFTLFGRTNNKAGSGAQGSLKLFEKSVITIRVYDPSTGRPPDFIPGQTTAVQVGNLRSVKEGLPRGLNPTALKAPAKSGPMGPLPATSK